MRAKTTLELAADDVACRFDDLWGHVDSRYPSPTPESIDRIERHFGIRLPAALIHLEKHSKSFAELFLGLGPDFDSFNHIVRYNSYWRRRRVTRRVPRNLVIMTNGFMDEKVWCLDMTAREGAGELAVQFWCPTEILYASEHDRPTERYASFDEFIEAHIYWMNDRRKSGRSGVRRPRS